MEDLIMPRATFHPTMRCNLKCRLCAEFAPYNKTNCETYSLKHCSDTLEKFFKIVTYVNVLAIGGGEPLLHPELPSILNCLKKYKEQIGTIQFVTNGTIGINAEVADAFKSFGSKLYVHVDDYGSDLSKKVDEIRSVLEANEIRCSVRNYTKDNPYCGGWVDHGDPTEKRYESPEEIEQHFMNCAEHSKLHFCFPIIGSIMYPCSYVRYRKQLGLADNYNEYIDLFDDTLSIDEQRQKIKNIYAMKSLEACAYCDGLCEDSPRVIPAEQLTRTELQYVAAGARSYAEVKKMMQKDKDVCAGTGDGDSI